MSELPALCRDCRHREDEHEWPYGCARCACEESYWGFPEGDDRRREEDQ